MLKYDSSSLSSCCHCLSSHLNDRIWIISIDTLVSTHLGLIFLNSFDTLLADWPCHTNLLCCFLREKFFNSFPLPLGQNLHPCQCLLRSLFALFLKHCLLFSYLCNQLSSRIELFSLRLFYKRDALFLARWSPVYKWLMAILLLFYWLLLITLVAAHFPHKPKITKKKKIVYYIF